MQPKASPIRRLVLASALAYALSSCDKPKPQVGLSPPPALLSRADEPQMTEDALTSEEVYERQRDAKIEWGRENAAIIDRACFWLQDAGVKLDCPPRRQ